MKNTKSLIITLTIIILIVVGFFIYTNLSNNKTNDNSNDQSIGNTDTQNIEESSTNIKSTKIEDLSTLILKVEDFPKDSGWTLKERSERGKTDVSDEGLVLGWKRGYMASYLRGDINLENLDYSRLDTYISEYPPQNISLAFLDPSEDNETTYDALSNPQIGDNSRAYKAVDMNEFDNEPYYIIEFTKMNLYERLILYGTRVDYELLKDLAKKAEAKV